MGWTANILCIGVFLLVSVIIVTKGVPTVTIPQGTIQGKTLRSREGKSFHAFHGIPYAKFPERFEPAGYPPDNWEGVLDGRDYRTKCIQLNLTTSIVEGQEACLYINVFTPNVAGNMSVMVFIHGGGFQFGLAYENGPEFILDHDVVFVTFSYRLAALGFLSTGDSILPGNLGLKDQNLALRWVHDYINYFGGDKNRVTLFGESAGSASVSLHMVSPMSRNLFRHAICQSGSSLDRWPVIESPKRAAVKLATILNCPNTTSSIEIVKCLKSKPAEEIVGAELRGSLIDSMISYGPVIEESSNSAFLVESPFTSYEAGRFSQIPLIITVNDLEGLLINALSVVSIPALTDAFNNDWEKTAATAFVIDSDRYTNASISWATSKIRDHYFGSKLVGQETLWNLTDAYTDSTFLHRSKKTAILHSKYAPVYVSILAFKGIWSQTFGMGHTEIHGMTHADDLQYLFTDFKYPPFPVGSETEQFSKLLTRLWVNFADTANPGFDLNGQQWLPVSTVEAENKSINWLYLKNQPEFLKEPFAARMNLWDQIDEALETGRIPPNKEEL